MCLSYSVPPHPLMSGFGEHVLTRANSSACLSVSLSHFRFLGASSLLLSCPIPVAPPFFAPLCLLLLLLLFPPSFFLIFFCTLFPTSVLTLCAACQMRSKRFACVVLLYLISMPSLLITNYIIMNINLNYTLPSCLRPGLHRPREGGRERDFMMRYCP